MLFVGGTTDYARAFRRVAWRDCGVSDAVLYAPRSTTGALVKAPRALGEAFGALLAGKPLLNWSSSDGLELRSERLPFAWAHLKLAGIALWPIGKIIVPIEDATRSAYK